MTPTGPQDGAGAAGSAAPVDSAEPARMRAQALLSLHRYDEALAFLGPAIAQHPGEPFLLVQAALCLVNLDRSTEALGYLTSAAGMAPDAYVVYLVMAVARRGARDLRGSYDAAVRSAQLAPEEAETHVQVALSALALHDQVTARRAAETAVRLAPNDPDAHLVMSLVLVPVGERPGKDVVALATSHVHRALELSPGHADAANELARLQMTRGRFLSAAGHLSDSVRADPLDPIAQRNMDVVLTGLVGRLHWVLFAVWFVGTRVLAGTRGQPPRAALVGLGVLGAAVIGYLAWQLARQVPSSMRRGFLRGFAQRDGLAAVWGGCLLLTCVLFLLAAVLPGNAAVAAFSWGGPPLLLGAVLSWIRFFLLRRPS